MSRVLFQIKQNSLAIFDQKARSRKNGQEMIGPTIFRLQGLVRTTRIDKNGQKEMAKVDLNGPKLRKIGQI